MQFKIGDKVRLLNEVGEGQILSFVSPLIVSVLMTDGFELSFKISELVHSDKTKVGSVSNLSEIKKIIQPEKEVVKEEQDEEEMKADGIYLLFTPKDEAKLLECDIDIALVNNTDYDVLYSYSYKYEKEFVAMCNGTTEEGTVAHLDTIVRSRIEEYSTVKLDIIFFKNMPFQPLEPVSEIIKLKTVKFYKPNTYHRNPFDEKLSHVVAVCLFEEEEEKKEIDAGFRRKVAEFMSRKKEDGKNISKSHEHYAKLMEREVDLHLEEILDRTSGMSNGEKLNYQLNYFKRELENAMAGNTRKIVFIHGVGNGTLKAQISAILDKYDNLRYHDASFRKYGFGATEVIIK